MPEKLLILLGTFSKAISIIRASDFDFVFPCEEIYSGQASTSFSKNLCSQNAHFSAPHFLYYYGMKKFMGKFHINLRRQPQEVLFKKSVLKYFAKFTEKHLFGVPFLPTLQV